VSASIKVEPLLRAIMAGVGQIITLPDRVTRGLRERRAAAKKTV